MATGETHKTITLDSKNVAPNTKAIAAHPKAQRASEQLCIRASRLACFLGALWVWCLVCRPDCDLTGLTASDIATACMWEDNPEILYRVLFNVGWLETDGESVVAVEMLRAMEGKESS